MTYYAIKGVNHESHGFDHRLSEWEGVKKTNGKFEKVKLEGVKALKALLEAKNNEILETVGTGAIAFAPMNASFADAPSTRPTKCTCGSPTRHSLSCPMLGKPTNRMPKPNHDDKAVDAQSGMVTAGLSDTVTEDSVGAFNPVTGEKNENADEDEKKKEVISDEDKPEKSEKPKKAVAKSSDWLAKQPWHKGDKEETNGTTDETARPGGSKKSSVHRRPEMAGPKGPTHLGESATPDDIARMITEDPDILADGPIGGAHGVIKENYGNASMGDVPPQLPPMNRSMAPMRDSTASMACMGDSTPSATNTTAPMMEPPSMEARPDGADSETEAWVSSLIDKIVGRQGDGMEASTPAQDDMASADEGMPPSHDEAPMMGGEEEIPPLDAEPEYEQEELGEAPMDDTQASYGNAPAMMGDSMASMECHGKDPYEYLSDPPTEADLPRGPMAPRYPSY